MPQMQHVTYRPHNLDELRISNLLKLADYLEKLNPECFGMDGYHSSDTLPFDAEYECGTVACAAGHGPAAGIKPSNNHMSWSEYTCDAFMGPKLDEFHVFNNHIYTWLFEGAWRWRDNQAKGAAARIRHMLEYGVPQKIFFTQVVRDEYIRCVHDYRQN